MAALQNIEIEQIAPKLSLEEAAAEMYKIVENHYDDLGLSEQERDQRYESLRQSLDAKDAAAKDAALDAAAVQMAHLIEEYYDEIGLSELERDKRIANAGEFINTVSAVPCAKSA